ncbi:hypothetical protein [Nannocystis pusilla]|uniref:hypothetical protein n=1 Tax=Nannocystis pusilla TaxID=889268 RepID=UPI003B7E36DE
MARPATPPREAGASNPDLTPWTARRNAARLSGRDRVPARPRPSRVLAELVTDATP